MKSCSYSHNSHAQLVILPHGYAVVSLFIAEWLAGVRTLIKRRAPYLSLLDSPANSDFIYLGM